MVSSRSSETRVEEDYEGLRSIVYGNDNDRWYRLSLLILCNFAILRILCLMRFIECNENV